MHVLDMVGGSDLPGMYRNDALKNLRKCDTKGMERIDGGNRIKKIGS